MVPRWRLLSSFNCISMIETKINIKEYLIDAQGKKLGRIASKAASYLMGKNRLDFARNIVPSVRVKIENTSKIFVTNKKMEGKIYKSYSEYPGGLKEVTMKNVVKNKGMKEAMRIAIRGMLPKNKLRDRMMKNLIIKD